MPRCTAPACVVERVGSGREPTRCKPYLRFQMEAMVGSHGRERYLLPEAVQVQIGPEMLPILSLRRFELTSPADNTLSLLSLVWNGGLQRKHVETFAASLRKEKRLHLLLSVLSRGRDSESRDQSSWTDDAAEQRRLLDQAAVDASSFRADDPGYRPQSSDEQVGESRWKEKLRLAVEDTMRQPGKQVVLELLPQQPLRPPVGAEHWRIPADRDFVGERQVHTFAALGVVPVYRAHHDTPALSIIIPGGDASFGSGLQMATAGQEQLAQVQNSALRPALPPGSSLFQDLGGKDVYEAREAIPSIVEDLKQVYFVVARAAARCTPMGLYRCGCRESLRAGLLRRLWLRRSGPHFSAPAPFRGQVGRVQKGVS